MLSRTSSRGQERRVVHIPAEEEDEAFPAHEVVVDHGDRFEEEEAEVEVLNLVGVSLCRIVICLFKICYYRVWLHEVCLARNYLNLIRVPL